MLRFLAPAKRLPEKVDSAGRTIRALWGLAAAAVLMPLLLFGAAAVLDRSAVLGRQEEDGRKTLALLHEQAANLISEHEIILDAIVAQLRGRSWEDIVSSPKLLQDVEGIDDSLDGASEILLVDAAGRVRATTAHTAPTGPPPVPDRGCFERLRNGGSGMCITEPHRESGTGRPLFSLAKRLEDDGTFKGIVQVAISIDYFLNIWRSVMSSGRDIIVLMRNDGVLLVRYPQSAGQPVRVALDDEFLQAMKDGGAVRRHSPVDGVDRILFFRQLGAYPATIALGLDGDALLAEWYHNLRLYGAVALAATLALMGAAGVALRRAQHERRMVGLWRAEVAEREAAQAQLFHIQKMEAVGQLTGGVAHDFNNLLTVIGGNADLLARRVRAGSESRLVQAIAQAAESGAALIRQLLTFARRQTLRPEVLNLGERVHNIRDLLARSLREDIQIRLRFADGLWSINADPRELELALLNIGVNARDAMPSGGTLTIEARNATFAEGEDEENKLRGDYVALAVSDTGTGIEPGVLERIFEPFYTTKEPGKGSGLGLSQVYGFARQSGGAVSIRSRLGQGTTVTMYLPRAAAPAVAPVEGQRPVAPVRGTGTLLLVEDNPAVAAVTSEMLEAAGHTVHRVDDPRSALTILEDRPDFDLVLSDVVMPGGMSGVALAHELRRRLPRLPVVLTTGYSEAAVQAAEDGFTILRKPYSAEALTEVVARCMTCGRGRPGRSPPVRGGLPTASDR